MVRTEEQHIVLRNKTFGQFFTWTTTQINRSNFGWKCEERSNLYIFQPDLVKMKKQIRVEKEKEAWVRSSARNEGTSFRSIVIKIQAFIMRIIIIIG